MWEFGPMQVKKPHSDNQDLSGLGQNNVTGQYWDRFVLLAETRSHLFGGFSLHLAVYGHTRKSALELWRRNDST
jgi:hypothetical protein